MNYKSSCFYWEFVKIFKRILIVLIISFEKENVSQCLLVILVILLLYLFLV